MCLAEMLIFQSAALSGTYSNYSATHALDFFFIKDKVQMLGRYLHNKCELSTKDTGLRDATSSHLIRKTGLICCFCQNLKKASIEMKHEENSEINHRLWLKYHMLCYTAHAAMKMSKEVNGGEKAGTKYV